LRSQNHCSLGCWNRPIQSDCNHRAKFVSEAERSKKKQRENIHWGLLCLIQLQMKIVCSVNSISWCLVDVVITPMSGSASLSEVLGPRLAPRQHPRPRGNSFPHLSPPFPVSSSKRNLHKMASLPQPGRTEEKNKKEMAGNFKANYAGDSLSIRGRLKSSSSLT